tara:strand:- start:1385 stop:1765 length:381 start_codon:yes stop_codon:yes gene_type:complete
MSEWFDNQNKPSSNFRKLLQEQIEKANPRGELTAEETKRLSKLETIAVKLKRWWTASVDGKINLVVRYGSKPLEFAKGKNAIELASEAEIADVLAKVREAAEIGELDALIEQQAQFGRRLTSKSKS